MNDDFDDFDEDARDEPGQPGHAQVDGQENHGGIVALCDAASVRVQCELLLGRINEERLKAQMEVVHSIYFEMLKTAKRKNRWKRFIPFLSLDYPPSLGEIHTELQKNNNDPQNPFFHIKNRHAGIENIVRDTIIACEMHTSVPIDIALLKGMNKFGVEKPKPIQQRRIGF